MVATYLSGGRFRPVLLTTLTTALGLAPLLFETSPQAQFLIPMAVSLGFGIVVSAFMVLFVTPAVAVSVEDLRALIRRSRGQDAEAAPAGQVYCCSKKNNNLHTLLFVPY